jgi:hypothetical protein
VEEGHSVKPFGGSSLAGRRRIRTAVVLALSLVAVAAYAVEESVSVDVRWRVLPYQTLRLAGSSQDVTAVSYSFRPASALERSRGYIEDENAFRFRVVSNTPWRLQVRWANSSGKELPEVDVREHGRGYATLGDQPIVLSSGSNGAFDVGVDVRVALDGTNSDGTDGEALLICTIMPD